MNSSEKSIIAIGEAGFDKLKGPSPELQKIAFAEQVKIAEENRLPVIIHCVRAWDELMAEHKRLKPSVPWLIHGFRGNSLLAGQLISKGIYLSFWFSFIARPEASGLVRSIPVDRIFLETDGSGEDIKNIYRSVSAHLELDEATLRERIRSNFNQFFKI